jgi:oxaloacetate decarboxylase alpha subunit
MLKFNYQFMHKVYKGKLKRALVICCTRDEIQRELPILFPLYRSVGMEAIPYITYGIRNWLTDEYYGSATKTIADKYKPELFVLKDVDGLLTPERARTLIPAMIKNANGIPIELHSHGMSGFNEAVAVEAMKQGIRRFHTCIPPLANGSSHLNIFNVCHNARVLGLEPCINEEPLREASERLFKIAEEENLPIGAPTLYDERVYKHEVPGGVISTLESQLKVVGMVDQMDEVLAEIPIIVKELGAPLMITPHSQFIVTQATMNVAMGRWEQFIDGMIGFALGIYGVEDTGLANMDQNLKDKLLSDPRAKGIDQKWTNYLERRETETIEEIKVQYGMDNASDEDLYMKIQGITEADLKLASTLPPPKTYSF